METQGFYFKHRKDGSEAHLNVALWVSVCMLWFLPAVAFGQVQTNQYSPDLDVQTDIGHFSVVSSDELSQNLLDYDMGGVDLFRLHESPMDAFHGFDSEALIGPVWNLGSDHFEADQAASWSKNGGGQDWMSGGQNSVTILEGNSKKIPFSLSSQPSSNVTVTITGHDNTDLSVSPVSLTFTPEDWKTAQEVTLTAKQDADATRDPVIELSFTNSGGDTSSEERTVTILDDEILWVFSPRAVMEGSNFSLFVELLPALAPPSEDVTFTISGHQGTNIVPGQETLTFPLTIWQKPQILTVQTNLDTDDADEEVTLTFTASGGGYEGLKYTVEITIYDRPPFDEYVPEGGSIQSKPYYIYTKSIANPSVDITVTWSGFQGTDLTVGQAVHMVKSDQWFECFSYSFGWAWCTPTVQTDISAGQDSDDVDDQVDLQITVTDAPPKYGLLGVKGRVSVTIGDDDDPSLIVDPTELSITEGETGTFDVSLSEAPLGDLGNNDVTVSIPSRVGLLTADESSLTFTTDNYNKPQEVTLTAGHDDDLVDDFVSVILKASGGGYDLERARISVTIIDDDEPELKISPNPVFVNEGVRVPVFFEVSLLAEPSNIVTVEIPAFNNTDLWRDTNSLEFSPPRIKGKSLPVFIRADDDADAEDDKETITLTARGGGFDDVTGEVTIIVNDNDVAGAGLVLDRTSITVPENDTADFNVSLSTAPTADVTVTISDFISQDLSYLPTSLTFTSSDYNTRQTITVTSLKDDNLVDESETLTLTASEGGFDP